ncbi:MAG: SpvB/TcaC N-terminal domain-containing protein [Patescibacteria group bacterium]|jgi:RHS repeat-associated protein
MKKFIIVLTLFTTIFSQPLLALAEESAVAQTSSAIPSPESVAPSPSTDSVIELAAPAVQTIPDPTAILQSAEPIIAPTADSLMPQADAPIIAPIQEPAPINNPTLDNQAVNLNNNEPQRDPGEGENAGAYQQEKSADNSSKKSAGLTGNLRVDQFSGAASYNIGLDIPAGRAGLNPSLLLAYNSHDKSNDSWVGQGWNLELGSITRSTKRGTNNLYTGNEFTISLGGQSADLIEVDANNHLFAPKEENSYLKIQYLTDTSSWLVIDTNGIKYYFGQSSESRQDNPADQTKIFKWQLDKVQDTNDNFYRLEHTKVDGAIYPSKIIYTGNGGSDGVMEVLFNLEERGEDISTSYQTQFLVTTNRRLNNIEIKVQNETKLKYQLAYVVGQNGRTSLLRSIIKKGYDGQGEHVLPATTFNYSTKQTGWDDVTEEWQDLPALNTNPQLVDLNGDSWVDIGGAMHDGRGTWSPQGWRNIPSMTFVGDINGDKLPDIVAPHAENDHRVDAPRVAYLNNGVNGFNYSAEWSAAVPEVIGQKNITPAIALVDINGDGLADIIYGVSYQGNNVVERIYLNNGHGWAGGYGTFPAALAYHYNGNDYPPTPWYSGLGTQIVDINGDGLVDVTYDRNVYLNLGSGFEQQPNQTWQLPALRNDFPNRFEESYRLGGTRFTDLNGDGLVDITVAVTKWINERGVWQDYFASWLNTGSGWQENNNWNQPMILLSIGANGPTGDEGVRMMDINNDNNIDIVKSHVDERNNFERQVYLGTSTKANQLTTITNGYGGQTGLEYQPSGKYFTEDNNFKNPHLPLNLETVKTITTTDGQNNEIVTSYDYQDGAVYADPVDYTLNQFVGFGIVTSTTGNQVSKTYYHQGSGIDGYANGEYEDTIYKKGRAYREEVYQKDQDNNLTLQSAKVSTWKQYNLDNNRKYVYLDGTVNYDYTQEGEQQQQMAPQQFNQAQAINQQAIAQSLSAQVLSSDQLTTLQSAQTFSPITQPQLVSQSDDGLSVNYYIGRNQNGQHVYQYQVYSDPAQGEDVQRDDPEAADFNAQNGDRAIEMYAHNCDDIRGLWENHNGYRDYNGPQVNLLINQYGHECELSRIYLPFNTSDLPDEAMILSSHLDMSVFNLAPSMTAYVVRGLDGNVSGGSEYIGSTGRNSFNLNDTGLSWISLTGNTNLGLRGEYDFRQNNLRAIHYGIGLYLSEAQNENDRPMLVVEYTLNRPPQAPIDLQTENQVNPAEIQNQQPSFSAVFNDENQDDQAIAYRVQVIRATNLFGDNEHNNFESPLWDSGRVAFNEPVANGARSPQIQYGNQLPLDGRQYFWRIKFYDSGDEVHSEGLWSDGQDYFYMDGSAAPVASINLLTDGRIEPRDLLNQNPSFSAIYQDPNPIDNAKWYQVQVGINADLDNEDNVIWDSDKQELDSLVDNGVRSEEIQYNGEPLAYNGAVYYFRIKFWDKEGDGTEGEWSAPSTFGMFNSQDVLSGVQAKAVKMSYDFSTGNVMEQKNLGTVLAAQNGVFLNTAEEVVGDEKNSLYQYAQPVNASSHILSVPREKIVTNPNTEENSTVTISYDGRDDGQVEKANPTKEDLNAPQAIYQKTFNAFGLVTQTTDPLNHQTNVTYDAQNYYPVRTTNHLNQITQTEYDLTTGQIKKITDPNGLIEERDYDAFGRLVEVRKTNPASTNLLVLQRLEYHDAESPSWVRQISYPGQSAELSVYTYFDGLGRTIQTREQSEIANQFRVTSVAYNEMGNVAKQTSVCLSNGFAYSAPDWNTPHTEYIYDAQNRVLSEEFIGDANHHYLTSYAYDGWNVTVTDPNGQQKKLYKDAYGQLTQVDEYLEGEVYSTKYQYNLLGKLINITDSQNNTRNFVYDELGRLTSQEEVHKAELDEGEEFGVWNYQYDSASNLIQKTDPKNQVINYTYDSLNRILTENFAGQDGTEVTYTYDSGTYGKGRLYRVVSEGATTTYTYDKWGRVTKESKIINGNVYNTQWVYNVQSVPTTITYPDNSKIYYTYNRLGLPITLRTAEPAENIVSSHSLITSVAYSPLKQIAEIRYNSGIVSTNTFDPTQCYRLTAKRTVNPFNLVIQDLTYSYDNVGNITQLVDQSQTNLAKTTVYEYDDLYRLTRATVTNSANNADYTQTYDYDIIGNILNKSDVGDYSYQNANPYQANSVNNVNYSYDLNGNLTSDTQKTYHYNHADRLTTVDIDEDNVLYSKYDQGGQRTIKQLNKIVPNTQGGETTLITKNIYPASLYEEEVKGLEGEEQNWQTTKTRHITLGNQTLAHFTVNPQGQVEQALVFGDHLGSASLLTDVFGRPKVLYDYYPFGGSRMEEQVGGGGMRVAAYQYTGKEKDEVTGLNYFGARYQNADIGRFTQVDPVINKIALTSSLENENNISQFQILSNPQSLNNYSYAINNPIVLKDTNGEWFDAVVDFAFIVYDIGRIAHQFFTSGNVNGSEWSSLGLDVGSAFIPGVVGLGMVNRAAAKATQLGLKVYVKADEIKDLIKGADKAFDVAKKAGGKHNGDYINYLNKTNQQLADSVASHMKQVDKHIDKLNNPSKYIDNFEQKTEQEIQGYINHWKKDLLRNQEQANIKSGILKERVGQSLKE